MPGDIVGVNAWMVAAIRRRALRMERLGAWDRWCGGVGWSGGWWYGCVEIVGAVGCVVRGCVCWETWCVLWL